MKSILKYGAFLLLLVVAACATGRNNATPEEIAELENLISNQRFEIRATWAQPMASQGLNSIANAGLLPPGSTASRIDITGATAYLRVVGDSVMADLPYFGERRMGGYYNQDKAGIKFEGIPENLTFEPLKKGDGKTMSFTIDQDSEGFQVYAQLYPNGNARITISSTHRTNIWYQGNFREYEEEK
ncbi:MAG: DUF4251 domain-containing protein [Bacteroidota bacterium]|uniref:DUF4251 domain-containing protein n=1 Tax=Flagellimonas okinawensis TaxID=3031324 RepID=A0ABT5XIM9_9FLAO|nr:DUF4251 domain-containing protein [[Muricauda] okinawensis]MDF0705750.1 DUF4251 domain-containing protein [[Muricauda] okinawensis]MEC8832165.1 DUF4251 domain-containing protein [Bacteroidota bacterium]